MSSCRLPSSVSRLFWRISDPVLKKERAVLSFAWLIQPQPFGSADSRSHCTAGKPLVVRFQSDAGTGGLLDAVDRLSPLPGELTGAAGAGWTGGIPRPALSPSDSDNVSAGPQH